MEVQLTGLSDYLLKVQHNLGGPFPECIAVADNALAACVNNLSRNQHLTSARLFQTGFGSWRSSVVLALAGSASQVPATLRHALECSLYAYICARDADFEEIWLTRETDSSAKKSMRGRKGPLARAKEKLQNETLN